MKLLLDQGLPFTTAEILHEAGHDAVHTGEIGMSTATDQAILDFAISKQRVVVTLDSDFHTLLALADASAPSVIRIRVEGLKSKQCAEIITKVVAACAEDVEAGAAISVLPTQVRVRRLPLKTGD